MRTIKIPQEYKYICAFLTMRCNLSCSFCLNSLGNREFRRNKLEELSGEEWIGALNKIESRPEVPITLSGGEPFLHRDFFYILKHLKPELNIDILTNLHWGNEGIEKFIHEIDPKRLRRDSPYASIRVSYHPEQMGDGSKLVENAKRLQDADFSVGIWSVLYPSPEQLSAINQMQFRCRGEGIDFRLKEFTGRFEGTDDRNNHFILTYGDYSKYPASSFQAKTKSCLCKASELLIGPDGCVYRCHRDLYAGENEIGNILSKDFEIKDVFRECDRYGECHPCDVKVKTDYKQRLGHTSVEIKEIK